MPAEPLSRTATPSARCPRRCLTSVCYIHDPLSLSLSLSLLPTTRAPPPPPQSTHADMDSHDQNRHPGWEPQQQPPVRQEDPDHHGRREHRDGDGRGPLRGVRGLGPGPDAPDLHDPRQRRAGRGPHDGELAVPRLRWAFRGRELDERYMTGVLLMPWLAWLGLCVQSATWDSSVLFFFLLLSPSEVRCHLYMRSVGTG